MKYTILNQVFLCSMLVVHAPVMAISVVYNFRIAQVTKPAANENSDRHTTILALLFDIYQKKYDEVRQNFAGGLSSYIYNVEPYYFRIDAALSHLHACNPTTKITFADTETDDILFTVGRNFRLSNNAGLTLSGLFGIPTHNPYSLQHVEFGYAQVGMGIQLDGFYALTHSSDFLYGLRYIYFIPRFACDNAGLHHRYTIGNIGDMLLAYKKGWNKHGIEFGYTFRSEFGAHVVPFLDNAERRLDYVRSNFYLVYKYTFLINETPHKLYFNIAYGFDHFRERFSNKAIVTLWASWNINF